MSREDDLLRQALAQWAKEETDRLEQSLSPAEIQQAGEAYRRHRGRALGLIRKHTATGRRPWMRALQIAAALLILFGAAYLSLNRTPKDHVILTDVPTASVVPYYAPTPSPTPEPTDAPTETPKQTVIPTETPTETPSPTDISSPVPTNTPLVPSDWQGGYYPENWPQGSTLSQVTQDENSFTAVYTLDGQPLTFTEYRTEILFDIPENADVTYVQWGDIVALRVQDEKGVTLAWQQDGRSFSLFYAAGDGMEMARSVKKISGE